MPPLLEFIMAGPPLSQQAKLNRRRWQARVREAARQQWGEARPVSGAVAVTITYFFREEALDVDNIPRPILNALEKLVYANDVQVSDLLCRKRRLEGVLTRNPSEILQEWLENAEPFTHILVEEREGNEVVFA